MGEYSREQRNQLSRVIANNCAGSKQLKGAADNRDFNFLQMKRVSVIQRAYINAINSGARYPHLHTAGQYMGYTYTNHNHVELRANSGAIHQGWLHTIGYHLPHMLTNTQRNDHQAILNWIIANEPTVWAARWHY